MLGKPLMLVFEFRRGLFEQFLLTDAFAFPFISHPRAQQGHFKRLPIIQMILKFHIYTFYQAISQRWL